MLVTNVIKEIIDLMRKRGAITNIVNNGDGTLTITSVNHNLFWLYGAGNPEVNYDYVKINDTSYQVSAITISSGSIVAGEHYRVNIGTIVYNGVTYSRGEIFTGEAVATFTGTGTVISNDKFKITSGIIVAMEWISEQPYYYYGTLKDINSTEPKKYPAIFLLLEFNENPVLRGQAFDIQPDLTLLFLYLSNFNWTGAEQDQYCLEPCELIRQDFLAALSKIATESNGLYKVQWTPELVRQEAKVVNTSEAFADKNKDSGLFDDNSSGIVLQIAPIIRGAYPLCYVE